MLHSWFFFFYLTVQTPLRRPFIFQEYLVYLFPNCGSVVQHTIKATSIFAFSEVLLDRQVSHFDIFRLDR